MTRLNNNGNSNTTTTTTHLPNYQITGNTLTSTTTTASEIQCDVLVVETAIEIIYLLSTYNQNEIDILLQKLEILKSNSSK